VQFVPGCGPERAQRLERLGVATVRDLLFLFPRDYQDLTDLRTVAQLEEGKLVSVLAEVVEVDLRGTSAGRSVLGVLLRQDSDHLRALWFNQPFMRERFRPGQRLLLAGKPKMNGGRWEMVHPQVQNVESDEESPRGELLPVYPLTEGLQQRHLRRLVRTVLDACGELVDEVFPPSYLAEHNLLAIRQALPQVHFPQSREQLELARRRFVYQELFVLQLALALKRHAVRSTASAIPLDATAKIDARIRRLFPFALTDGQNRIIREIAADLSLPHPMNRLLEGDVGSGKTAVAVYAMLLAVAHGAQAVLMAPTEVLARQHIRTLEKFLAGSQVQTVLLAGSLPRAARREVLAGLASGQTQIVVGTQAVLEEDVAFQRLGLVVIDEQHKFGVEQRLALRQAGVQPHYLVMTATPIPRTVGMALYGDLDISQLRERPPGRQPVHTYLAPAEEQEKWWEFFRKQLREGRQGYVIVPLIEGSEKIQAASLEEAYESLANGELEAFRLNLVHGRMKAAEKDAVMQAFADGEIQVLVATSVVEVGVDVPNATVMTILGADRFGLAQLHQLRGRINRGSHPGYCCLLADRAGDDVDERLAAIVRSQDGFELAEIDFDLRGPGDLMGTRQHGLPPLRIADLRRDMTIVEEARADAQALVAADSDLSGPEHALLRRMVLVRYSKALDLGDVG